MPLGHTILSRACLPIPPQRRCTGLLVTLLKGKEFPFSISSSRDFTANLLSVKYLFEPQSCLALTVYLAPVLITRLTQSLFWRA